MYQIKYSKHLFYFTLIINVVLSDIEKFDGEKCEIDDDIEGICRPLSSCSTVLDNLHNTEPKICNTEEDEPVVCCPMEDGDINIEHRISTDSTTTTTEKITVLEPPEFIRKTKSYQMCVEYGKYVYTYEKSPLPNEPDQKKSQCGVDLKPLVVGGEPAAIKEFPHMVALGYTNDESEKIYWECGGTLISDLYVLTAAHCLVSGSTMGPPVIARMGMVNLKKNETGLQEFRIVENIKHPKYVYTKYHDIALLKLDRPVKFTAFIRPACLHIGKEIVEKNAYATGWGKNGSESDIGTDELMKVKLAIVDVITCNNTYNRRKNRLLKNGIVDDLQICAGFYEQNKDTCQGDSGGPLQVFHKYVYCMYDLIGVTSFGLYCGFSPAVYTRVSNYVSWIESVVWP